MSIDSIDLNELSYDELVRLQRSLNKAIESYGKRRKRQALDEVKSVATKHGFSLDELLGGSKGGSETKSVPRYRNPSNAAETWTGKGRKPGWVVNYLDNGGDLDNIRIPD